MNLLEHQRVWKDVYMRARRTRARGPHGIMRWGVMKKTHPGSTHVHRMVVFDKGDGGNRYRDSQGRYDFTSRMDDNAKDICKNTAPQIPGRSNSSRKEIPRGATHPRVSKSPSPMLERISHPPTRHLVGKTHEAVTALTQWSCVANLSERGGTRGRWNKFEARAQVARAASLERRVEKALASLRCSKSARD